jgi:hypothetical protein
MKEFVIRGKTDSDTYETINFGGHKDGYGFLLTEFKLWPSVDAVLAGGDFNMRGAVTRGKLTNFTANSPDFSQEGLIGNAWFRIGNTTTETLQSLSLVNDTALITQDIILHVIDVGTSHADVNWQCKFMPVKLTVPEQALANYRQFSIFDE